MTCPVAVRQNFTFPSGVLESVPQEHLFLLLQPNRIRKCTSSVNRILQCKHKVDKYFSLNFFKTQQLGSKFMRRLKPASWSSNIQRHYYIINDSQLGTFLVLIKPGSLSARTPPTPPQKPNTSFSIIHFIPLKILFFLIVHWNVKIPLQ